MFKNHTALNLVNQQKDIEVKKPHIDNYYSNIENIMRKNNVGFFNTEPGSEKEPPENPQHSTSQQPVINETNYNVHLKNENGIVNINLINNSGEAMFSGPFPRSQGYMKIDEVVPDKYKNMKHTSHSTSVYRNKFKRGSKNPNQTSITLSTNLNRRSNAMHNQSMESNEYSSKFVSVLKEIFSSINNLSMKSLIFLI